MNDDYEVGYGRPQRFIGSRKGRLEIRSARREKRGSDGGDRFFPLTTLFLTTQESRSGSAKATAPLLSA